MKLLTSALVASIALASVGSAHAYFTFFGEDPNNSATVPLSSTPNSDAARSQFLAGLVKSGTETFETQTTGASAPLTLNFPGTGAAGVTATLLGTATSGTVIAVNPGTTNGAGRYSIPSPTSSKYWEADAVSAANNFSIFFSKTLRAFGFYGVDIGDFGGRLTLQLLNGGLEVGFLTVPNAIGSEGSTDGSVLYFGLGAQGAAQAFDRVNFGLTANDLVDVFAFDNFTIAETDQVAPVPTPATLPLLVGGLLALALTRRRIS
jgi:hypothetical protein